MRTKYDITRYLLALDDDKKLFTSSFIRGNRRLNKTLTIAEILYIAQTGGWLVSYREESKMDKDIEIYLAQIYVMLETATFAELKQITDDHDKWRKEEYNEGITEKENYRTKYSDALIEMAKLWEKSET